MCCKKSKNGEIPVIEGQIAFLQSMILPIALMLILLAATAKIFFSISGCCKCCATDGCPCPFVFGEILVWLLLFPLIYNRIMKVHAMVWDYYEYTKRIEK